MKPSAFLTRLLAGGFAVTVGLFLALLAVMFYGVFLPDQTLFSNDGPLSQLMAACHRLPDRFAGCWLDLNNVGFNGAAAAPSLSFVLQWLLGPVWFSKFYAMISLLILGTGAWCFLRQMQLSPLACVLGGLAAILNATFFSVACWGMGAHNITIGLIFFALAALADPASRQRWLRVILAGMALGMAVTEGADVGAILSLYVAAFILYQTWTAEGSRLKNTAAGLGRLTLVVVCAVFLAAQSLYGLVTTSIVGVSGAGQDAQTKMQHWDWATQWSLPKREVLNLVVPGLFGFRADTPEGGCYWGMIGRDPAWEKYLDNGRQGPMPTGFLRYNGGGNYVGGLVALVAIWTAAQTLRRKKSIFTGRQRKWLWFWLAVAVGSLLLALGRFAPFYQLVYALPYFSTIRNPVKFLYPFNFALIVLFAYGIDGLLRQYMPPVGSRVATRWAGLKNWWNKADKFEKFWIYGCGLVWLVSLLAWWQYAQHREALEQFIQTVPTAASATAMASFSIRQAGWFVVAFFLAAGLLALILSGAFAGRPAVGGFWLAALLVADLGLANQPWIVYWNYPEKYASNPVIDRLRDKPYEHRVALVPLEMIPQLAILGKLYKLEWMQQQFPRYNIQSFELVEMSRPPEDLSAFIAMINATNVANPLFRIGRAWQLSDTRYILGSADAADFLRRRDYLDSLEPVGRFELAPKPGIARVTRADQLTAFFSDTGRFGLFELTNALPRAKLFSHWQVNTNGAAVLEELFNPAFDPALSVIVDGGPPPSPTPGETNPSPESVEIVSYAPKDIVLHAEAATTSILLLNDHFDPNWKVSVDGQPRELLRCNFLMRGVRLPPGTHQVEFRFQPPIRLLYVSLAAEAATLLALGMFVISVRKHRVEAPAPAALAPLPAPAPKANAKRDREPRKTAARSRTEKR
jgi:hypothetical protein